VLNKEPAKATSKEIDQVVFMGFIGLKRLVFFEESNCGLFFAEANLRRNKEEEVTILIRQNYFP
jgi:hypothetical protein